MKKIIFAFTAILIMSSCAFANVILTERVGFLTRLNTTEEEFFRIIQNSDRITGWKLLSNGSELYGVKFYDSLNTMLMALDKHEIGYEICCVSMLKSPMSLAFGFSQGNASLVWKFNRVIRELNKDWTLPESLRVSTLHFSRR